MSTKTANILGVVVDAVTKENALYKVREFLNSKEQNIIATVNAEFVMASQKDDEFRNILNSSSLKIADGIGILWAAKYLSMPKKGVFGSVWQMVYSGASLVLWQSYCKSVVPERISGADVVLDICKIAVEENKSIFLLGGQNGSGIKTAEFLRNKFHGINISGVEEDISVELISGQPVVDGEQLLKVIEKINTAKPDILFVALGGNQKQEKWIHKHIKDVPSVKVAIGVGATFDFLSGSVKRAPSLFRSLGIEWLWRMVCQRRLSRVTTATVRFIARIVSEKI